MRAWLALGLMLALAACTQAGSGKPDSAEAARPAEAQAALPEYPKPENYLPLPVSATTPFTFFVDAKSVSVGKDEVIRYSLIARSGEGVVNVSYEGIRCASADYRVYAYGRTDNTWSEVRISLWQPIPADARNAQRAVLYDEYFCTKVQMVKTTDDAVRALRRGPAAPSGY